jgi:hypothetical protein
MSAIPKPDPIKLDDGFERGKILHWVKLDPTKALYGSVWGLLGPKGSALLIFPREDMPPSLVCVGLWSGIWPTSLEAAKRELLHCYRRDNRDSDHRVSADEFESWR